MQQSRGDSGVDLSQEFEFLVEDLIDVDFGDSSVGSEGDLLRVWRELDVLDPLMRLGEFGLNSLEMIELTIGQDDLTSDCSNGH